MVEIRRPVELSENIIDLRVRRSPRGALPWSAAAMLKRKKEDLMRQQEKEFRRQQEQWLRDAVLRTPYVRRGRY